MASIFTYDPNPPRVSSPWSTPGRATPQPTGDGRATDHDQVRIRSDASSSPMHLSEAGISRLEPEPQEGSTEYKLHLLLRPRRGFSSTSTSVPASNPQQSKAYLSKSGIRTPTLTPSTLAQPPSRQSREVRLQQLTTQLLWRLQQSSPFHSSSSASLVLPNLPEATPRLGVPSKPARLLPGLEESQGALYEIGVSDDGTFVGLTDDELEESLTNLKAMAASLGCVVEPLRKVIVGHCEWSNLDDSRDDSKTTKVIREKLWVAEALIRPDMEKSNHASATASPSSLASAVPHETLNGHDLQQPETTRSEVEQLRVSLAGASTSGKSSLLGTLTTSTLDNGRGKSRLNLLKHRHEVASGVTSSVAQELVGYHKSALKGTSDNLAHNSSVINYASENVSSWNDIHASAARLIFLSDSPGLQRYSKSAIRTLVSWKPHWTVLCVAANQADEDQVPNYSMKSLPVPPPALPESGSVAPGPLELPFAHLELCLKLGLPMIVAVTKMDIATKLTLRQTLSRLLTALKTAGRKPVLLSSSDSVTALGEQDMDLQCITTADETEVQRVLNSLSNDGAAVVPIVLTSALGGAGIGKLHGLLRSLPVSANFNQIPTDELSGLQLQTPVNMPSKLFHIDEVFAMPPSKVYSASKSISDEDKGTVLCGYVGSNAVHLGDVLSLGPFLIEHIDEDDSENHSLHRSISFPESVLRDRPASHTYSKSIPAAQTPPIQRMRTGTTAAIWQTVRVVSIRNLRLPTRSLLTGQVGTIGVEPVGESSSGSCDLRRARKGMVLASFPEADLPAYPSFTASFPAGDFKAPNSPPLILGGHATAYINSIRAAVKVSSVAIADHNSGTDSPGRDDKGVFNFDGDEQSTAEDKHIRIKFKFLNSVEWMSIGDQILVVPNAAAVGPITGGSVAATGGLNGFVGRICDLGV
jgi:GTPase